MTVKKELIKREIAGDVILVPVGKTVYDSNGLFVLNELGDFLWEHIPNAESEKDLLNAVLAEYEVSSEVASADIAEFLDKLRKLDIID